MKLKGKQIEGVVKTDTKEACPRTCGFCKSRFPAGAPIPIPVPDPSMGKRIIGSRPQMPQFLPVILCREPTSPRFNQMMYVEGSCEAHQLIIGMYYEQENTEDVEETEQSDSEVVPDA